MVRILLCGAMLAAAGPVAGASREPLIVTPIHEPDLGIVAAGEPRLQLTVLRGTDDQQSAIDEAIESFGRAIGQAARADQQAMEAKCRSSQAAAISAAERLAWATNCGYRRR